MTAITIRFARVDDVGLLLGLIRELAAYEKMPDAAVATEADFTASRVRVRATLRGADRIR
jgi:hypothetical protein